MRVVARIPPVDCAPAREFTHSVDCLLEPNRGQVGLTWDDTDRVDVRTRCPPRDNKIALFRKRPPTPYTVASDVITGRLRALNLTQPSVRWFLAHLGQVADHDERGAARHVHSALGCWQAPLRFTLTSKLSI